MIQFFYQIRWACFKLFSSIATSGMSLKVIIRFVFLIETKFISFYFCQYFVTVSEKYYSIVNCYPHKRRHFSSILHLLAKLTNSFGVYWLKSFILSHNFINPKYASAYLPSRQVTNGCIAYSSCFEETKPMTCPKFCKIFLSQSQFLIAW